MVWLWVIAWQPHIFVHIERHHVLESAAASGTCVLVCTHDAREFSIFDEADEVLVCRDGRRACRQTEHEGFVRRRPEVVDPTRSD
jgi:hypothetical protein